MNEGFTIICNKCRSVNNADVIAYGEVDYEVYCCGCGHEVKNYHFDGPNETEFQQKMRQLIEKKYYVDFEMESDFTFTCCISDGYYDEDQTFRIFGEGKTVEESLENALDKPVI